MSLVKILWLVALLSSGFTSVQASHPSAALTPRELAWIQSHPVLRVGVVDDLIPFEYMSNAQLRGLSTRYLQIVTDKTGLKFTYVPGKTARERSQMLLKGQVDVLSSYLRHINKPVDGLLAVPPYHISSAIIVTRVNSAALFSLDQLAGKTVMIPDVERYEAMFKERGITATVIKGRSAQEMLITLKEGGADAVVASETYLMPYLYRQFQGLLQISGVVTGEQLAVGMAVREDHELLYSILDKTLSSITVQQRQAVYLQWYKDLDLDVPNLWVVTQHYWHALILAGFVLLALFGLVYLSYRQRRLAVRSDREKSVFLAVMSQEIRSPISGVLAALKLLGHTRLDEQQRYFTQLANNGAHTLLHLLDAVLDMSRLESGQLHLTVRPTDILLLVHEVAELHQLRARQKHLSLTISAATHLPALLLDPVRTTQILHNLITNAIKFTDTGSISLSLSLSPRPGADDWQLEVEVRDTGIGISASAQASLFRPYAQTEHSHKRSGGSGLGLVICRQLVDLMKGSLVLSSALGIGTTMTIRLPVKLAEETDGYYSLSPGLSYGSIERLTNTGPYSTSEAPLIDHQVLVELGRLVKAVALHVPEDALDACLRIHDIASPKLMDALSTYQALLQARAAWDDQACTQALVLLVECAEQLNGYRRIDSLGDDSCRLFAQS